jgi:hypothetical protein
MTAFTGSAFAGNGQGNDTAPGQVKQAQAAAAQPAPATQAPGQVKKEQQSAASTQSSSSQQSSVQTGPGVKPNSNTTHWTHCVVGGTAGATTCTSSDNGHTPQPNADASKRYGNGMTAAQIVVSRGGSSSSVELTGPGNSQPHKVTVCGKPNNKSGGVDVHAVKSYPPAGCAPATTPAVAPVGSAVVAPTTQQQVAVASVAPTAPTAAAGTSPVTQSVGGVAGVQMTLKSPKPARGGVLGTVTNVAGTSLPFTGFPIWFAVVIALALVGSGVALRRRSALARV